MMSYCVTGHSHLTLLSSQVMSGRKIEYKTLLGHEEPLATDSLFDPIWMSHTAETRVTIQEIRNFAF